MTTSCYFTRSLRINRKSKAAKVGAARLEKRKVPLRFLQKFVAGRLLGILWDQLVDGYHHLLPLLLRFIADCIS
jgi:hypothetical protein